MGWLFRPLFVFGLFTFVYGHQCILDTCNDNFRLAQYEAGISDPESTDKYCSILRKYKECLSNTAKYCRGEMQFHGAENGVKMLNSNFCTKSAGGNGPKTKSPRPSQTRPPPPLPSCRYYGNYRFKQCSLFGDPHLKTFDGQYQTCRIQDTWTLIENGYLSVKVTSSPVEGSTEATAPTKIKVVVKGRTTPCTLEKVYEADSQFPLPPTFMDGTDKSGHDKTVTLEIVQTGEDRETAEIFLRYVATKLTIRRKGKFLAFNVRIPEDVIQMSRINEPEEVELCASGCPPQEQLDVVADRGHLLEREEALRKCQSKENLSNDIANNLTDSYLDWCVFDLMTAAGKNEDFVVIAHAAQQDALQHDVHLLRNRTTLLDTLSNSIRPTSAGTSVLSLQLPFSLTCLVIYRLFLLLRI